MTSRSWSLLVLALMAATVVGPFAFGIPVLGHLNGFDSNFALDLTRGYLSALRAGQWFPRWLPDSNAGMGSPVFYFYGRLPFLIAALLGRCLRLGPVGALIGSFVLFRAFGFWTCRYWLRTSVSRRAADCGALFFIAVPYAMSLNPITRVGLAETAATAFIPLVLLHTDAVLLGRRSPVQALIPLSLTYAAIAWCHLPQLLLTVGVTLLYLLLRRSSRAALANIAGVVLGALLAAPSFFPAILLRNTITSAGWNLNDHLQMRNNFLFTKDRLHMYGLYSLDMELYGTWFLCLLVLLIGFGLQRRNRQTKQPHMNDERAAGWVVVFILIAVTGPARPFWLAIPSLQVFQFPWRLFPVGLALTAALLATWALTTSYRQKLCLALVGCLVLVQLAIFALGAGVSLSTRHFHFARRPLISYRLPVYAPWPERNLPEYARRRSFVPEYIPAEAGRAGWRLSEDEQFLLPGPSVPSITSLESDDVITRRKDGAIQVETNLKSPASLLLPVFYFPDEILQNHPEVSVNADPGTGLARVQIPAGHFISTLTHNGSLPCVVWGHVACLLSAILLLASALWQRAKGV